MLTPEQQERYARHLLLDGLDQERVMAASVRVVGRGVAAHWAARYLAASGVGGLAIDEPAWTDELLALGPWLSFPQETALTIEPIGDAMNGALAAVEALRKLAT